MKTATKKIIIISTILLTLTSAVSAHPGRTDSNGGHTCRTNCDKWGLEKGEYHYHNQNNEKNDVNTTSSSSFRFIDAIVVGLLAVIIWLLCRNYSKKIAREKNKMYCKYCGKLIDKDSIFCFFCGADISKISNEPMLRKSDISKIDDQHKQCSETLGQKTSHSSYDDNEEKSFEKISKYNKKPSANDFDIKAFSDIRAPFLRFHFSSVIYLY